MFSYTLAITHGKTFDSSLARISARGKIISDVDRAESKRSRRERHIKGELCGRARECCLWESFCSSINSVPSSPRSRALTTDTGHWGESPRRVNGHDQRSLMSNAYENPRSATCDSNRPRDRLSLSVCMNSYRDIAMTPAVL